MGTALIYDEEMANYRLLWFNPSWELEVPERLTVSHEALVRKGLAGRCVSIPAREATETEILLAHSEEYLEAVKTTPYMSLEDLKEFALQYDDVFFHPNIYRCAKLAVGAALQLVDSVVTGKVRNGMALVRPPGHHSMRSAACGYCVFNNVAIAAHYAKQKYGLNRVLIVDWDIHHGQGVQYCFEDNPDVLYFSWHRFEHQQFWPELRESDYDVFGKDQGTGFNINLPWNKVGMKNSDYLAVFCHVLLPVAYEFCPDLVLVCGGFDSAIGDPEGQMCATPDVFAHLTHLLMHLAGGKLCVVLEGGYNLTSLAQSVCETVQTLLGDPAPRPENLSGACKSALESIQCVRSVLRPYWSSLKHAADLPTFPLSTSHIKLSGEQLENAKDTEESVSTQEKVWPELQKRFSPLTQTALVLPDGMTCPDGCERFSTTDDPDAVTVSILSETFLKEPDDSDVLQVVCSLAAIVKKMEKNEIGNALALVHDVPKSTILIAQYATAALASRVLVIYVGDCVPPAYITEDWTTLLVQISKESEEQKSKYHIPVCLRKGFSDVAGFIHTVLSIILPLGYEYNPSLVLLAQTPGCDICDSLWLQLCGLLHGLAQGHTLVLMQEDEKACVGPTASSLLGSPAPSLGQLHAPEPEDVKTLERLRLRLQADWKLLQNTAQESGGDN
ncbi:polyamine deacetylase HDAC10 [Thalassophryne amazonica]|uniref:polyamine deacetylase HDAC10 n=1 Tax=Thalassophryne amazonica TaxID=390379 RepID=UPI0014712574|nr:polyamine deacetylase HDAC10 [Thalassophryne amazonica]